MANEPERADLSELEACVLGLVWDDGPCTPYAVRRVFRGSLSPQWSGSAGAIYPLFGRLETRRLIRSEAHVTGHRRSKRFTLTPQGLRALRAWLAPPLPGWAIGVPVDPLRTRLRFLGALPPRRRAAFMADLLVRLQEHLRDVEADCERRRRAGDPFEYAMARGALHMARARRDWAREIAATVGPRGPSQAAGTARTARQAGETGPTGKTGKTRKAPRARKPPNGASRRH